MFASADPAMTAAILMILVWVYMRVERRRSRRR